MVRSRLPLLLILAIIAWLAPLQPIQASADSGCPRVVGIDFDASVPINQSGVPDSGIPWVPGGQQVKAVANLDTSACTPGGVVGPPPFFTVFLQSSNSSAASVPNSATGGNNTGPNTAQIPFVISTSVQSLPAMVTITATTTTSVGSSSAQVSLVVLASSPAYTVTDLGALPGQTTSWARGINNQGRVVGLSGGDGFITGHAFVWDSAHGMQDLGTLQGTSWNNFSTAEGINDTGVIVGTSGHGHPVTWQNGVIHDLGTLGDSGQGMAINSAGDIAGSYDVGAARYGFFAKAGQPMVDLGTIGGDTYASSINDLDSMVGISAPYPVVWNGGPPPASLGVAISDIQAANQGGDKPVPRINNAGEIVYAFVVRSGGAWSRLPSPPIAFPGNTGSAVSLLPLARGLNNAGDIVGILEGEATSGMVVKNGMPFDLNWLIDQSSGYVIREARAINDHGLIAATGFALSACCSAHALLLTPVAGDTTPPVIAPHLTPAPNTNGWNNSDVTVTWSVTDPESGIGSSTGCGPTTLTAETAGTTLTCSAVNGAGLGSTVSVTLRIDETPPVVTYSGNAGAYTVDQTVAITCSATDALSGIFSKVCHDINGPAYTFNIGTNTLTATATDLAGNVADASTSFTVSVTPSSLCTLTVQFIEQSSNYQLLVSMIGPAAAQALVQAMIAQCQHLDRIDTHPQQRPHLIAAYDRLLSRLAVDGWLSVSQAALLTELSTQL